MKIIFKSNNYLRSNHLVIRISRCLHSAKNNQICQITYRARLRQDEFMVLFNTPQGILIHVMLPERLFPEMMSTRNKIP